MGEKKLRFCDLCKEPEDSALGEPLDLHGVVITIGYSKAHPLPGGKTGSWGNRKNAVEWTGEVCDRCFSIVPRLADQFEIIRGELAGRGSRPRGAGYGLSADDADAFEDIPDGHVGGMPRAVARQKPVTYFDVLKQFLAGWGK